MTAPSVLLDAWAAALGRACWQGGLVVLVVWSISRLMRSMPARFQCWFWRLAILKFLLVPLCPFLLNVPLLPAPPSDAIESVAFALPASDLPINPKDQISSSESQWAEVPWFTATLFSVWIIGAGWSVARLLSAWRDAERLREQGRTIDYLFTAEHLMALARRFGSRTSPQLLEVPGCGSPMTIGILRPVIVIPAEILRQLTISEQTMVLAHELAHIRRGDLFWSFVAALVRAVFFFHPLVWLSQRQLTLAQEIAADELAIARQQHDPVGYGKLLVSVVGKLGPGRMVPTMSMGTTGPMESLTRRLVAMTLIGCGSRRVVVGSAVLLGAVLLLGLVPWRLVAAEPKAVEKAPSSPAKESTKVTAGAAAYAGNNAESKERNQHQLLVKLKVSENRPGKPEEILCRPHVVTRVGQNSYVMVSGNELQMIVEIQSSLRSDKIEAVITAKLTHDPEGNNPAVFAPPPVVLAVPSPTMANAPKSQTAILEAVEPDSSIFRLEATITTTVEPKQQGGSGPSAVVSGAGLWPWVFQPDPARGYGPSAAASGAVYRSPAEAPLWKGYYVKDLLKPGKDGATNIHGLIERIKSQVTPSAWADHSGPAEITPYSEDALVVKHTPKGHEEVVQMLQQLRRRDDIKQAQAPVERHAR